MGNLFCKISVIMKKTDTLPMIKLGLILLSIFSISCNEIETLNSVKKTNKEIKKVQPSIQLTTRYGTVKAGQGFFNALKNLGIDHATSLKITNELRDEVEFSKLKVGDNFIATFNKKNEVVKFVFSNMPAEKHVLNLVDDKFKYEFIEEQTHWKYREITGNLRKGSTLQADLLAQGLKRVVAAEAINVLLCKINFRFDARTGDEYKIFLKERVYKDKVIDTKVLYTSYSGTRAGKSEAYFYDDGEKSTYTAHYTEDGEALIRSGLRYPLKRLHIRSGYGRRRHPVTGRFAMHRGVDLRARTGTPVHAVARGVVVESSYNPYAGNKVGVRHSDGSTSFYFHLNSRSVKKGQRVRSHQVIGTVGATGRVTGPHLHFGFKKPNGRWMNPMAKRMIATPKLKGDHFTSLKKQILEIKNTILALNYKKQGLGKYVMAFDRRPTSLVLERVLKL